MNCLAQKTVLQKMPADPGWFESGTAKLKAIHFTTEPGGPAWVSGKVFDSSVRGHGFELSPWY